MIIIPAIDIRNGKCVRLRQGNFAVETVYSEDPIVVAKKWESEGAKMLHLIDLDGAKNGQPTNLDVISRIITNVNVPVQVGGGIQSEEIASEVLAVGAERVIIGTLALENKQALQNLVGKYSERIIVSLDLKNGTLAKRGWFETTNADLIQTAQELETLGVKRFIYTNVLKDGTLSQPDYAGVQLLLNAVKCPIIVAGGISSVADIKKLKGMGAEGAIVGKALYEGKIDVKEANNAS